MPPTIGKAIRLINSEPVPVPNRIGINPAKMTATVIALGEHVARPLYELPH